MRRRGGRTEIVLGACPYVDAVEANPAVVCAPHLGMAEAAAADAGEAVEGLTPRPPRHAGCRLALAQAH